MLPDFVRFRILNSKLRNIKLLSAGASVLFAGAFLGALAGRNIISMAFYGIAASDLLRVSYNCYIKNYVCLAMSKLGGTTERATETFFAWMSSSTGLAPSKDPFTIIQNDMSWEILTKNTISVKLYLKVFIS